MKFGRSLGVRRRTYRSRKNKRVGQCLDLEGHRRRHKALRFLFDRRSCHRLGNRLHAAAKGRQMANESTFPPEVYGVFCGGINQDNANKLCSTMAVCMNNKVEHVHLLFQSLGESVSDGIFLHSFFKSLPIQLTLYNAGQVSSSATVAYLGAD